MGVPMQLESVVVRPESNVMKNFVHPPRPTRVLVVEDDPDMADIIKAGLQVEMKDIHLTMASDPYEALNLVADECFDIMILDWNLPDFNGYQTIKKAEDELELDPTIPLDWDRKQIPVVVISSHAKTECRIPLTKHFKFAGHVDKKRKLTEIIHDLKGFIGAVKEKNQTAVLSN